MTPLDAFCVNHTQWAASLLSSENRDQCSAFPYRLDADAEGTMCTQAESRSVLGTRSVGRPVSPEPSYHLMIPTINPKEVPKLLTRIRDQGVPTRTTVSVGVNWCGRLDERTDARKFQAIREIRKVKGIDCRIFGACWLPQWNSTASAPSKLLYPARRAFRLARVLRPDLAEKIEEKYDVRGVSRSQIPYQRIREWIKNHPSTQQLVDAYRKASPESPVYVGTFDDDVVSLQNVFQKYDKYLEEADELPVVLSGGYVAAKGEKPVYRLGILLDHVVRLAMAKYFPKAPYYPEPNFFWRVRPEQRLSAFSFLGKGNDLESRRLIENMVAQDLLAVNQMAYVHAPVVTSVPDRMKTNSCERITTLGQDELVKKSTLKALRGLSQSNLFARNWCNNVYGALSITSRVTDMVSILAPIMQVFDPISLAYAAPILDGRTRFTAKDLPAVLKWHRKYCGLLKAVCQDGKDLSEAKEAFAKLVTDDKDAKTRCMDFFEAESRKLLNAKQKLFDKQLPEEELNRVVMMALRCGLAVAKVLQAKLQKQDAAA